MVSADVYVAGAGRQADGCCCTSARSIGSARFGSTASRSASTRAATIRSRSTSRDALRSQATPTNELVVAVTDPTDTGTQPRGKQVLKPHGIFYTAVTGIWQTVWLEPVPLPHIESLKIVPNVDRGVVAVTVKTVQGDKVSVKALDGKATIFARSPAQPSQTDRAADPERQTCGRPISRICTTCRSSFRSAGKVVDTVNSYFGMRKIEVKKDAEGHQSAVAEQQGGVSIRAARSGLVAGRFVHGADG